MHSTDLQTVDDYHTLWQTSNHINWTIQDLIGGDKRLNFTRPFLPDALARVSTISCLNQQEKLKLNQIRGNSYLYLFGLCEEFILPSVIEYVSHIQRNDLYAIQAYLHFAEEESKHILLFRQFAKEFEQGFGIPCECIGPAQAICDRILAYHPLAVALMTLHIEWMTQRHYLESVRDNQGLDPQFCRLLRYHWLEEAQHAKLGALMVQEVARGLAPAAIEAAIADYFSIIDLLDQGLQQQVQLDLESLSRATNRQFSTTEQVEIQANQLQSYRWTFLWSGMTHQNVRRTFVEICPSSKARLLEKAKALG
uniref:Ferritin-like domain-containing protein n=1 Tax=Oscillatoriales cyanobacterium SpSt-402 TaxID=2282168 RepID=A0A832M2Q5_9CYAN